jgi:hypothetical protein
LHWLTAGLAAQRTDPQRRLGYRTPSQTNAAVFAAAVDDITAATERLLDGLVVAPGSKPTVPVQRRLRR